ncbi:MAG TPA: response regulator [Elusimicrobiota bacterium]|jgi:two-component system chemotaxis response regulator CheY|nr:response regulator [Elusimicrobiota bacterium]
MESNASLRFLIVDDNEAIRMILTDLLVELGHQVVGEAEDLDSAVSAYEKHKPDLVTLDLSLSAIGGGDGLSVLKALRLRDAAAKVIVVSGNSQRKVCEQLEKEGAVAFVPKPIKGKDLTEAIAWATRG